MTPEPPAVTDQMPPRLRPWDGEGCFVLDYLRQEDPLEPRRRFVRAGKAGDHLAIEAAGYLLADSLMRRESALRQGTDRPILIAAPSHLPAVSPMPQESGRIDPVIPPTDEYPDRIEAAVKAILGSGVKAGRAELEPITFQAQDLPRRKAPTPSVYAEVYRRDRFACRYCGGRVIPTPIMRVLATLYPDIFPYHPNWKVDRTHPAFLSRSPSLDHLASRSPRGRMAGHRQPSHRLLALQHSQVGPDPCTTRVEVAACTRSRLGRD